MKLVNYIESHLKLPQKSIENTVKLLNEDCTVPFISRYRKEATGNLDEVQVFDIVKYKKAFEEIEKRKISILKSLEEQDVLNDELKGRVESAETLTDLEDIYLPYKKKRKTKADTARENKLEPLAKIIMSQNAQNIEGLASRYVSDTVLNEEEALEGARYIIAEWINERIDIRNDLRRMYTRDAVISSKAVKSVKDDEKAQKFKDYFDWSEPLHRCPSHRLLAMLRAEKEGFIRIKIEIDKDEAIGKIESRITRSAGDSADQIKKAIEDAYKRLLTPALENEILSSAKEKADSTAISVFAKNLQQLLLGPPLGEKNILAIDPGFRTGCKIVCLNKQGDLAHNETIYPHAPQNESAMAIKKINSLVNSH